MINLNYYGKLSEDNIFQEFLSTIQKSITPWNYFVDWEKVKEHIMGINTELNILNSLIGSKNIETDFVKLCTEYPNIKKALPLLIAIRKDKLKDLAILEDIDTLATFDVKDLFGKDNNDYESLLKFFAESGLKDIFADRNIKNLVDYVTGVETGMDTNGRKNRTGIIMENLVEREIKKVCDKYGYEYNMQVTTKRIKSLWDIDVPTDKSARRFDFVIKTKKSVVLVEVNFYNGGGSKLKATAGEYMGLSEKLKDSGFKFIWITDGPGWNKEHTHLEEAFYKNDYIFNLSMLKKNILEEVL